MTEMAAPAAGLPATALQPLSRPPASSQPPKGGHASHVMTVSAHATHPLCRSRSLRCGRCCCCHLCRFSLGGSRHSSLAAPHRGRAAAAPPQPVLYPALASHLHALPGVTARPPCRPCMRPRRCRPAHMLCPPPPAQQYRHRCHGCRQACPRSRPQPDSRHPACFLRRSSPRPNPCCWRQPPHACMVFGLVGSCKWGETCCHALLLQAGMSVGAAQR